MELFTWILIAFGVLIIHFGILMAIEINKDINRKTVPAEHNWTRLKLKGEK